MKKFINYMKKQGGWGIAELLSVIVGVIVVVLIMAPAIKSFSTDVIDSLTEWWTLNQATLFQG